jgi:hypothetical protein
MTRTDAVIAVAGWEDRFRLGLERDLTTHMPGEVLIVRFEEYSDLTNLGRTEIQTLADERGIRFTELRVTRDRQVLFERLRKTLSRPEWQGRSVLIDISTMPREVIWWTCSFLRSALCEVRYVYYPPTSYSDEWITRDTDSPRLVYQHSGLSAFGKQTCLMLLTGFDTDRANQMIQFFEPTLVSIGLQTGSQFDNETKNIASTRRALARSPVTEYFEVDAYSADRGYSAIAQATEVLGREYNVVAASLGPKPSAIAMYQVHLRNPEMALAYAPSRQFNPKYSAGIGAAVEGLV